MQDSIPLKLSICISTLNRARFIAATLDSVIGQMTDECEILVSDNASTDDTERVVREYSIRHRRIRYIRHETDHGVDQNYDRAVKLTRGEYCWLTADDDLFKEKAISTIITHIRSNPSLVVVNTEFRDFSMSKIVLDRFNDIWHDITYQPSESDRLLAELGPLLAYNGCVIIRRDIWLSRHRDKYYGCWYIHLAVIFQRPLPGETHFVSEPLISYRDGNAHTYSSKTFEVGAVVWPALIWSLAPSDVAKSQVWPRESWRDLWCLLMYRAWGYYSMMEFRDVVRPRLQRYRDAIVPAIVALVPGSLINSIYIAFYLLATPRCRLQLYRLRGLQLHRLTSSRYCIRNSRIYRLIVSPDARAG